MHTLLSCNIKKFRLGSDVIIFTDFEANVSFVDMDPHSLIPPCFEPSVVASALLFSDRYGPRLERVVGDDEEPVSIQGRLKNCVSFRMNTLKASEFVLGIIRSGYRLPFIRFPPSVCVRNHRSALENQ